MNLYKLLLAFSLFILIPACASINSMQNYSSMSDTDKRLYDIYMPFMIPAQRLEYVNLKTSQEREDYVKRIGLYQKLHSFGPEVYEAILNRTVILNMPEEAVLFSMGPPTEQHRSISATGEMKQMSYRTYLCGGAGPLVGEFDARILAGPFGDGCVRYFKNITLQNGHVINIFE